LAPFFDPDVVVRFGRVWSAFDKYGNPTYAAPPNAATPAARTSHFAADGPRDRPTSATRPARDGCGGIGAAGGGFGTVVARGTGSMCTVAGTAAATTTLGGDGIASGRFVHVERRARPHADAARAAAIRSASRPDGLSCADTTTNYNWFRLTR